MIFGEKGIKKHKIENSNKELQLILSANNDKVYINQILGAPYSTFKIKDHNIIEDNYGCSKISKYNIKSLTIWYCSQTEIIKGYKISGEEEFWYDKKDHRRNFIK